MNHLIPVNTHTYTQGEIAIQSVLTCETRFYVNCRILELKRVLKIILDETFFIDEVNKFRACYLP